MYLRGCDLNRYHHTLYLKIPNSTEQAQISPPSWPRVCDLKSGFAPVPHEMLPWIHLTVRAESLLLCNPIRSCLCLLSDSPLSLQPKSAPALHWLTVLTGQLLNDRGSDRSSALLRGQTYPVLTSPTILFYYHQIVFWEPVFSGIPAVGLELV